MPSHLDIDLTTNTYFGTATVAARAIPAGVPVSMTTRSAGASGVERVTFFPNGGSGGGQIVVGSGAQSRVITIDVLTGMIRISRGKE